MSEIPSYKNILVTKIDNPKGLKVGQIQLNRPDVLNALNIELMGELLNALRNFDADTEVGCIIITGIKKHLLQERTLKKWLHKALSICMYATSLQHGIISERSGNLLSRQLQDMFLEAAVSFP